MTLPPPDPAERALAPLRELLAIAQNGLTFATDQFDRERYARLREIVSQLLAEPQRASSGFDARAALSTVLTAETGYATPKVDVRGAAFRDGRILMVRERSDGLWALPGGWADVNQ